MATSTVELSAVDTGVVDTGSTGAESQVDNTQVDAGQDTGSDGGSQEQVQEGQTGDNVDGRRGAKAHREAVRAAQAAMPEHAKAIKEMADNTYRLGGYQQVFPKVEEAMQARDLITALGGVEGAATLQERITAFDAQEAGYEKGDPAVLDSFFKDFPDGAAKLAPAYLERLGQTNPRALEEAVVPYAIGMLANAGVPNFLKNLASQNDAATLKAGIGELDKWIKEWTDKSGQIQSGRTQGKGDDSLQQERQTLQQEREQLFQQSVESRVDTASIPVLEAEVDRYAKQEKMSAEQKKYYQNALKDAVFAEMKGDKTYLKQVDIRKASKTRTADTVASYISQEFNRRVKDKALPILQDTLKLFGKSPQTQTQTGTGVPRAGGPNAAPGGQPIFVTVRPPDSELNLDRKGADMDLIHGRAYTKAGKFITWRK